MRVVTGLVLDHSRKIPCEQREHLPYHFCGRRVDHHEFGRSLRDISQCVREAMTLSLTVGLSTLGPGQASKGCHNHSCCSTVICSAPARWTMQVELCRVEPLNSKVLLH